MKSFAIFSALAACAQTVSAVGVYGAAEGFAKGVTGGGNAKVVYPQNNRELIDFLGNPAPFVIVLDKTFDFRGTEGTTTAEGCAPYGTGAACQLAINGGANWCNTDEKGTPKATVHYDNAGILGIQVTSDKTLIGVGSSGIIQGKGLRIVSGSSNIIIQNIKIEEINPQYVWGGDAITIDDADMVWIDRVTTYHISRQHIVLGTSASNRVTISNHYLNGASDHSATCNGYHYWGVYLTGSGDLVTMKNNYFYRTSGRMPKVQGNTLLHAVNNYWYDSSDHLFEIGTGGYVLAEGNVFQNIPQISKPPMLGGFFTSPDPTTNNDCVAHLGRACQINAQGASDNGKTFTSANINFLSDFAGKNIASAQPYNGVAAWVNAHAGFGKI